MEDSAVTEHLYIRFESPEQLQQEYAKNIANGGIFAPTTAEYSVRQQVVVEIELDYASAEGRSLSLDGEVVHRIPPELSTSGATPGVAIQFKDSAQFLRQQFETLLGVGTPVPEPHVDDAGGQKPKRAKRRSVRVPIRVMPESSPPFEATSRDLSLTGILLSLGDKVLPMGEVVRICLWHPTGEKSIEIDGIVVREVKNKKGKIAAVAVAFDRHQAADPRVREVTDALSQAGHRSQLGGISGSIADLGLANLLQMFGSSAPLGTVVCNYDGEQGWVAFADGALLAAEMGALQGRDALIAMLDWPEGRFEFEANADEKLVKNAERRPLAGAILEAVCAIDERDAEQAGTTDADVTIAMNPTGLAFGPQVTFRADTAVEEANRSDLGKMEQAVLDLVKMDADVAMILEAIPADDTTVLRKLEELVDAGLIAPNEVA